MRVLLVGGTGPVGQSSLRPLYDDGHEIAVAHSGAHEPEAFEAIEHLHGGRAELLASGGPVERWRPDVLVDTFAGGATAAKAVELSRLAERCGARQVVAVSSMDVYRHCALAGVDDHSPAALPADALPLPETAPRREARSRDDCHDNVAMEDALGGAPRITVLRPGAIYGRFAHPRVLREWYLVGKVARGERRLALPDGGTQLFQRVAVERVGLAIAAAIEHAPEGLWACNIGDPQDLTFGGLARLVEELLGWKWEIEHVPWEEGDHPWNVRHPVLADTTRLRDVLGVTGAEPLAATSDQIGWLWRQRAELAALELELFSA